VPSNKRLIKYQQELSRKLKEGGKRKRGDGLDSTLKNMGALMPAVKSRCWR
jgi:hypothetical protein